MVSATSDIAASVSFQAASPKSAKADQSPAPDSFSALVDSNATVDTANDRANSAAQDQPSSQRRDNDTPVATNNRPARGEPSSSDRAAKINSQDRDAGVAQSDFADTSGDANKTAKPAKHAKTGIVKAAIEAAVSETAGTPTITPADQAVSAPPAESSVAVQTVIAVAIPVVIISANVSAAPAPSGNTQAPLAIAAAAIASSSDIGAITPTAPAPVQTTPAPEATTSASPSVIATVAVPAIDAEVAPTPVAATATTTADPTSTAKVDVQVAASETAAAPVSQPAVQQTNTNVQVDPKLAAAVAVAIPAVPVAIKATANTSVATRPVEKAASTSAKTGAVDPSPIVASPQANDAGVATQQTAIDGKSKAADGTVDAAKPDATGTPATSTSTTPAVASPHEHGAATAVAQAQIALPDQSTLTTNTAPQPQVQSTAPTAVSATQLTVTAATLAPVPLNGLALQIAVTAQSGKSRFEIRLDPAELGRIDVRIDVDRHGQVTSHLTVEKPETLAMLRQDAPHLQRALDDAGLKTGDSGLQFSLRDQSSSGQKDGNETGRNSQRLVIGGEDIIPATVAGRTYGRTLGSSSGVDIRV